MEEFNRMVDSVKKQMDAAIASVPDDKTGQAVNAMYNLYFDLAYKLSKRLEKKIITRLRELDQRPYDWVEENEETPAHVVRLPFYVKVTFGDPDHEQNIYTDEILNPHDGHSGCAIIEIGHFINDDPAHEDWESVPVREPSQMIMLHDDLTRMGFFDDNKKDIFINKDFQ